MSKLTPIFTALDHQQYNRAIKLCLQQPADHWYAQALLAHAYAKSEQRLKALQVLVRLLTKAGEQEEVIKYFVELQLEHQYAQTGQTPTEAAPAAEAPASAKISNTSKGKKGKKKPTPGPKPTAQPVVAPATNWDWIDALDTVPPLDQAACDALPTFPVPPHLADFHLLSTMQATLNHLRCNLSAYQLYAWWANTLTSATSSTADPRDMVNHLRETFGMGLAVCMAPQYQHVPQLQGQILPALQVLALQIARMETELGQEQQQPPTATLWAAQTALWQLQETPVDATKMALLPRLAESLALKMVQQVTDSTTRLIAEGFLLYCQALAAQDKWSDYAIAVQERLDQSAAGQTTMGLTTAMLLDYLSFALHQQGQTEAAREIVAKCLREQNPDQWNMWIRHLEYDDSEQYETTIQLARELTLKEDDIPEGQPRPYPRRGPPLVVLEALRRRIDKSNGDGALLDELLTQIQCYGDAFASRTACTFSDLKASLGCICQHGGASKAAVLLPWLQKMRTKPAAEDSSQRRAQLRAFIFAHQTTLTLLDRFPALQKDWLPDWKELVRAWKEFQSYEDDFISAQTEDERKNAQKESRPADEVILLAVQILLVQDSSLHGRILAATLLEKAIQQSPYNAYLKLSQIFVCADLNAVSRSWDLFRELFIKHIQHESCIYLILPLLRAGGMYQDVLELGREVIRLQIIAFKDGNEYTGKALSNGTLSKADEFIRFQRYRMNKSLTTLEVKGMIMDCAPMFKQDERQIEIGSKHGIVGGSDDMERVRKMISEAHNPQGTFTLLRWRGSVKDNLPKVSENRDLNAMEYEVFGTHSFPTTDEVVCDCIRRSHHHSLLLRAALCVDATKGPKKGKVAKASEELSKRCKSLLSRVKEAETFAETDMKTPEGYGTMIHCMANLCRAIAVLSGGFVKNEQSAEDSISFREDQTAVFLGQAVENLQCAREQLNLGASASRTGLALPDVIVPVLALLRMCANINEVYGWSKKRRKIRKCAGCLYDFAMAFRGVLDDMDKSLENVQISNNGFQLPDSLTEGIVPDVVSTDDVGGTLFLINGAQGETKFRIDRILKSICVDLESFDTEE